MKYSYQFLVKAGRLEITPGTHDSCWSSRNGKLSCKGSPECGIAMPSASHSLLAASQELSANLGTSGTGASPATGSEPTPESTAGAWRDPWGQTANILKLHRKMETFTSGQGSRSSVKLSSTRNHCWHTSASLGSHWNSTGTGEQKERRQMAKMSSHILSVQALTVAQHHMGPNQLLLLLFQSFCLWWTHSTLNWFPEQWIKNEQLGNLLHLTLLPPLSIWSHAKQFISEGLLHTATPVTFLFNVTSLPNYQRQFLMVCPSSVLILCMSFTALVLTTGIPNLPVQTPLVLLKQTFWMRRCRWEKPWGSQSSAVQVGSVTVYSPLWSSRTMTVSCKTAGQYQSTGNRILPILQIKPVFKSK